MALIVADPIGGLGNRLLCLLSVLRLARRYGLTPRIHWGDENAPPGTLRKYRVPFYRLFADGALLVDSVPAVDRYFESPRDNVVLLVPEAALGGGRSLAIKHYYFVLPAAEAQVQDAADLAAIFAELRAAFAALPVAAAIGSSVAGFAGSALGQGLGIHVRRAIDPEDTPEWNRYDAEWYASAIRTLRARGMRGPVFLASNCAETKARIQAEVPDVLSFHSRLCGDATAAPEIEDAFVDLLLLSRCGTVLRHVDSTFGLAATVIGGGREILFGERAPPSVLSHLPLAP